MRALFLAITLCLCVTANADTSAEPLWQRYLQQPSAWPARDPVADNDVAALPQPGHSDKNLVRLGQRLFHDTRLSRDQTVSCASCHQAEAAFGDPRRTSPGVDGLEGHRNSPSLMNVALWETLFWDGRSADLEHQALLPLTDPVEMDQTPEAVEQLLREDATYNQLWCDAFGCDTDIEWPHIAEALAVFQRTLVSPPNPLDKFIHAVSGDNHQAARDTLTDQQLTGLHLFRTKAGCIKCHQGPLLSDQKFHNMGLHYFGRRFEDLGRYEVTGRNEHMGSFRTPTLRHLMQTRPWMHNGLFNNLEGIVRMYEHGGARPRRPADLPADEHYPETTALLTPFSLTDEEREALLAFLRIL